MIAPPVVTRIGALRGVRGMQPAHAAVSIPEWLEGLLAEVDRYRKAIQECPILVDLSQGTFSLSQVQDCVIQLYPFVQTFPEWISLIKEKKADAATCAILTQYGRVLRWYVPQWIAMAEGFGVHRQELFETPVRLNVEALNQYLWFVSRRGSMVEGVMSLGYAIGSVTRSIAPFLLHGFTHYEQRTGIVLRKQVNTWVRSQAQSSDWYIRESLEIVMRSVSSKLTQDSVSKAVTRSLAYLLMVLEECGLTYDPWHAYRRIHNVAA